MGYGVPNGTAERGAEEIRPVHLWPLPCPRHAGDD